MFEAAKCSRGRHATAKVWSFWRQCWVDESQVPLEVQQSCAAGDRRRGYRRAKFGVWKPVAGKIGVR
jgi:hypothetical protein